MKEKRKRFIQMFALAVIMLLIAGASYAYFGVQTGEGSSTDIIVNTSTVDNLTFETGEAISINATQSNFGSGAGNQSDDTYASATLVANNDTNEASANYYLYIKIDTNEFEYTTSEKTAELILSITDPDGNEVTSLSGLTYTSVTDGDGNIVSGFDITSKIGLITIAEDYLIESTGTNTQEWNIEVTFVNLDSNQSGNAGKSFSASLVIQSSIYGNTLQAYESGSEIWAYTSSITKIVFDDTGTTISDYEDVFDITDDGYCYYNGNEVYNFDNWSMSIIGVTEGSCNTVYKVTDDDYTGYFDDSYTSYITEYGSAVWDSDDNVCKTTDGNEVYTWYYWNSPTEEQCSGIVYYFPDADSYIVGIEYVGGGEWIDTDNYSSIQAYLANNGDDTYTVYIESDAPILGNEDMSWWFCNFTSLESIEGLDKLITSNVTDMEGMFSGCYSLITLDVSNWDTSNVTTMENMFSGCYSLITLDLSNWNTSNVTTMENMFSGCYSLITLDLSNWNTSIVTSMSYMFENCSSLTSLDLSGFNTSQVTTMSMMFRECSSLIFLDLSTWDTSNVTDMFWMFYYCSNLTSLNLSNFDTSKVTNMSGMFSYCKSLMVLDLSSFVTDNLQTVGGLIYDHGMFNGCSSLTTLDISNADFSNVTTYSYMFQGVNSSITITVKDETAQTFIKARLGSKGTVVIA